MCIYLSLGSNQGCREANLCAARDALDAIDGIEVTVESACYETDPVGVVDQPAFLNVVLGIETTLGPLELLGRVKDIERRLGRVPSVRWGPRVIDIDVVLWGDVVMDSEKLTLPHKEFRNRAFVLTPLAEIAPDAIDPVTGSPVAGLAAQVEACGVRRLGRMSLSARPEAYLPEERERGRSLGSELTCTRDEPGGH